MLLPVVDFEATNRCNAWCSFCPRDQTPHQGLMSMEVFDKALERVDELSAIRVEAGGQAVQQVSLCGLGEPILNRKLPEMVAKIKAAGYKAHVSSNGALITEDKANELLDAGLTSAGLNVGETGEAYEEIYKLDWERTHERVLRFRELAEGRANVFIVLVNHHDKPGRFDELRDFWSSQGIPTKPYLELINRGGALDLPYMHFSEYEELDEAERILDAMAERPFCGSGLAGTFVGYDGEFYLCCQDWKKEAPIGNVFDASLSELVERRVQYLVSREPVCKNCSLDPANQLTMALRAVKDGELDRSQVDEVVQRLRFAHSFGVKGAERLVPGVVRSGIESAPAPSSRKTIPVRAR